MIFIKQTWCPVELVTTARTGSMERGRAEAPGLEVDGDSDT